MDTKAFLEALSGAAASEGSFERFCQVLGQNPDDAPGIRRYLVKKFNDFRGAVSGLCEVDTKTLDRLIDAYLESREVRR